MDTIDRKRLGRRGKTSRIKRRMGVDGLGQFTVIKGDLSKNPRGFRFERKMKGQLAHPGAYLQGGACT